MHIHRTCFSDKVHAPDSVEELISREGRAGIREEQLQKLKLLIGQRDARAADRDRVLLGTELERARAQHLRRSFRRAAAQHRFHAGHKLHHPEGLHEIIIRAEVEPLYLVILRALRRGHNDGDVPQLRSRLHAAQKLDAVYPREHHVEHDKLRSLFLHGFPELCAIRKALGLKARGL